MMVMTTISQVHHRTDIKIPQYLKSTLGTDAKMLQCLKSTLGTDIETPQ